MSNGKAIIILLTVGMRKKMLYKMSYFQEQYNLCKNKIKVELYLSNYATKYDLKIAKDVDTSEFAKKVDLASLKSDIEDLDIEKLKTVPVNSQSSVM